MLPEKVRRCRCLKPDNGVIGAVFLIAHQPAVEARRLPCCIDAEKPLACR
jgi:hypothetical protein